MASTSNTALKKPDEIISYTGFKPGGWSEIPADFPNRNLIVPVMMRICKKPGPFQCLVKCGKTMFNLVLEHNKKDVNSTENKCLLTVHEGLEKGDRELISMGGDQCVSLFWPSLKTYGKLGFNCPNSFNIQLATVDGQLQHTEHSYEAKWPPCKPIADVFTDVQVFSKNEITVLDEIEQKIYKVRISGKLCCLKLSESCIHEGHFKREIDVLKTLPSHPCVIELVGLKRDESGRIDGIVLEWVEGTSLVDVEIATPAQKKKWKRLIQEAVHFVHKNDVVWGDAKAGNVHIDSIKDIPVLLDFGAGSTKGWVDEMPCDTKEGDMQDVGRILEFIDSIPAEGEA